jgi:hypothetical protein
MATPTPPTSFLSPSPSPSPSPSVSRTPNIVDVHCTSFLLNYSSHILHKKCYIP